MARQSEQLEREAEIARMELAGSLDELRLRLTPGNIVDQIADYTRQGPTGEFLRNLSRDVQENPLPLALIGLGVAWLFVWNSYRTHGNGAIPAADIAATSVADAVTSAQGQPRPVLVTAEE